MLDDNELLILNTQGFIPGPGETEDFFIRRVSLTKKLFEGPEIFFEEKGKIPPFSLDDKLKNPDRQWVKASLMSRFGFSAGYFSAYFSNEKLNMFQGAATWLLEFDGVSLPILQIRKRLKKGAFLRIYELEDILAHELAHFARAGFNEPRFEEFFAYFTSSKIIRKIFGPIAVSYKETALFLFFLFFALGNQYLGFFFGYKIFDILFIIFSYLSSKMLLLGFIRLGYRRYIFNKCYKKLLSLFKVKETAMSVMFRLTDKEIKEFSQMDCGQIRAFAEAEKNKSLRWKVISLAYFDSLISHP